MSVTVSRAGVIAVLQSSEVQRAVDKAAKAMASSIHATAHDGPVPVEVDRFKAPYGDGRGVTLAHPGGVGLEAAHGYLTDAAVRQGLAMGKKSR